MRKLFAPKDTRVRCRRCWDIVFVFNQDVFSGDKISTSIIYQDKGQAPWITHERIICRKCHSLLNEKEMFFEPPHIIPKESLDELEKDVNEFSIIEKTIGYTSEDIKKGDIISVYLNALQNRVAQIISKVKE